MEKEEHVVNISNGGDCDGSNYKVKMMCSYGGKIQPREADHQLTYVGGDTKILNVDRNIRFPDLITKLHSLCNSKLPFRLKYRLPGYDLDALVSVIDEVDLENMMFEYNLLVHRISPMPARFRIFVFFSDVSPPTTPDFLFGFDKEYTAKTVVNSTTPNPEASKNREMASAKNVDSDPLHPKTKQIQGIEAQEMGVMSSPYSRDNNVTLDGYGYGPPLFYRIPVPACAAAGYYQIASHGRMQRAVGNREQPVYTYVPVFPSVKEEVSLKNGNVAFVAVAGEGGGGRSIQPVVTSAATAAELNHETKVTMMSTVPPTYPYPAQGPPVTAPPPQYSAPPPPPPKKEAGFLEGCLAALCCCCLIDECCDPSIIFVT